MTYRETLQAAEKAGINSIALQIADEVQYSLDAQDLDEDAPEYIVALDDADFEKVCYTVEEAYLKYDDATIAHCAQTAIALLATEDYTPDSLSRWDIGDHLW